MMRREALAPEGQVEGDGAGGQAGDGQIGLLVEAHDRALAVAALDLGDRPLEGLGAGFFFLGGLFFRLCCGHLVSVSGGFRPAV